MQPQKLLITGASGFLGWNLCQLAQQKWNVYGTCYAHSLTISGVTLRQINLTDFESLKQLFQQVQPDAVIHTAAQSSPNVCQSSPEESHQINVIASWNLAGLSADFKIPFVFTSTEMVFNGLNPPYRETDPVCPINLYGEQKVLAEQGIAERYPTAAICRIPLMFGFAPSSPSFIQPFLQTLRAGQELSLFTDEFRTLVSGTRASQGLLLALEKASGILNLGGKERMSRYEFGCLMVEVLQLPQAKLKACRQMDVKMAAPRPPDLTLDSSIAFALGYDPGRVRAELEALRGQV